MSTVVTPPVRQRRRNHGSRTGVPHPRARVLSAARRVAALAPDEGTEKLAALVVEVAGRPIDAKGVAAILESRGMRDVDAAEQYGKRDIFDLAEAVFEHARTLKPGTPTWARPQTRRPLDLRAFLLAYVRGGFSFLPLLTQVLLLVVIGYSQWGWIHFTLTQASMVAMGAGLAMIGTGGFVQVLGYLGPRFSESGKHVLAQKATFRVLAAGMAGSALLAGVVSAMLLATGTYPADHLGPMLMYDGLISASWLLNGALYMVKRRAGILLAIVVSTLVVALVLHLTSWGIYAAHWVGLSLGIVVQTAIVGTVLARQAATTTPDLRLARFPRPAVLLGATIPLAVYGSAYFLLLLADRVVAWTVGHHPLPVWFNVRYELGLDAAMFAGAFGIAFLECILHGFTRIALPRQQRFSALAARDHNRWFERFFARQLAVVVLLLVVGAALAIGIVSALHATGALGHAARFYSDPVTRRVFFLALIGYGLLALGVANGGLLFNVNRARAAALAAVVAAVVDLAVGLLLSRLIGFSYAAVGLAGGGAVFALATGIQAARVLRSADYHLYAAY